MNRITLAALTALTLSAAAPAAALSISVDFPTLTFPPKPQPETTQSCTDLTTLNSDTCTVTTK